MKVPVDEAPAGAALDAAVAKVLGWRVLSDDDIGSRLAWETLEGDVKTWDRTSYGRWRPSTDIAAAWPLALKLSHRGFCSLTIHHNGMASCYVPSGNILQAASDAPFAICRSFLKANDVEFVEVADG